MIIPLEIGERISPKIEYLSREHMKTVELIVKGDLCVRCGGCVAICPTNGALKLDDSLYPVVNTEICIECGMCLKVCPFHEVDLPAIKRNVFNDTSCNNYFDDTRGTDYYVGHSYNDIIRKSGSSGGIVTQLLFYLLNSKKVNAVTVVTNQSDPLNPTAKLTSSPEEVIQGIGSKYTIVPVNERLKNIDKFEGKIAFVGLPCHIQSLRMWESFNTDIKSKIVLTIALFCNHNLEKEAVLYLLRRHKINFQEIDSLSFRHESWPGGIAVKPKNKSWQPLHSNTIKEAYNYLSKVYDCKPCRNCVDFCGELADISVGDPWLRGGDGQYIFTDSRSLIVARSESGKQHLLEAQEDSAINMKQIRRSLFKTNFQPTIESKRRRALHRINKLRKRGRPYPLNHINSAESIYLQRLKDDLHDLSLFFYRAPIFSKAYLGIAFSRYGELHSNLKNFVKKRKFSHKFKHVNQEHGKS